MQKTNRQASTAQMMNQTQEYINLIFIRSFTRQNETTTSQPKFEFGIHVLLRTSVASARKESIHMPRRPNPSLAKTQHNLTYPQTKQTVQCRDPRSSQKLFSLAGGLLTSQPKLNQPGALKRKNKKKKRNKHSRLLQCTRVGAQVVTASSPPSFALLAPTIP